MRYNGVLDPKKMSVVQRKALSAFRGQRRRCYNKKDSRFNTYGAKGILVEYNVRYFIFWYETNAPADLNGWCVGRKDHAKNYCFENIEFQRLDENSRESLQRNGLVEQKKPVKRSDGLVFDSITNAAKAIGVRTSDVWNTVNGHQKTTKGFSFSYAEAVPH